MHWPGGYWKYQGGTLCKVYDCLTTTVKLIQNNTECKKKRFTKEMCLRIFLIILHVSCLPIMLKTKNKQIIVISV